MVELSKTAQALSQTFPINQNSAQLLAESTSLETDLAANQGCYIASQELYLVDDHGVPFEKYK